MPRRNDGSWVTATFRTDDYIHAVTLANGLDHPATICGIRGKDPENMWDIHGAETWAWTVTCPQCIELLGRTQALKEAQARLEEAIGSEASALAARVRAALRLIGPSDITPMGVRIIEKVLDAAEQEEPTHSPWCSDQCWLTKTGEKK